MSIEEIMNLLVSNGYVSGWSLLGTELSLWEHDEDPPAPLTRPTATPE